MYDSKTGHIDFFFSFLENSGCIPAHQSLCCAEEGTESAQLTLLNRQSLPSIS